MTLDREEYVEQAYFFRSLGQRLPENQPLQDLLRQLREEVLATTKLPLAIDYLLTELKHIGGMAGAMARLAHYFAPFQTFLVAEAERDAGRFDMRLAVEILHHEADYRAKPPTPQGLFLYQFENLCRNRLSYDRGLAAAAEDPVYDAPWRSWILTLRRQIGMVDLADHLYVASEHYVEQQTRRGKEVDASRPRLFGDKEGRIALANRKKDPLFFFAALQRQLGYPSVPRLTRRDAAPELLPQMLRRLERLEARIKLLEEEQRGEMIDLSKFYKRPDDG